jgi:inorganic phosphate transporter, PiT family
VDWSQIWSVLRAARRVERLGLTHLTPAKGASAELVSAVLIGTAGFSGLPVSTTHIVTSRIAGTMLLDRG